MTDVIGDQSRGFVLLHPAGAVFALELALAIGDMSEVRALSSQIELCQFWGTGIYERRLSELIEERLE